MPPGGGNAAFSNVKVYGFTTCRFYIKAAESCDKVAAAVPSVSVEKLGHPTRDEYKAWLAANSSQYGEAATAHTSSPFVVVDGAFLGGCDSILARIREAHPQVDLDATGAVSVPRQPGVFHVVKCGCAAGVLYCILNVVRFIPPLRRFALGKVRKVQEEKEKTGYKSSYSSDQLMENAFNNPYPMVQLFYNKMRWSSGEGALVVGAPAHNVNIIELETGKCKPLLSFQQGGRPLVLNIGSQS